MATVTLLSRVGCHLCDEAREVVASVVASVAAGSGVELVEVDVDSDPELRAEYGDLVPVVLVDGVQHGYYRIDPERLRLALGG